MNRKFWILVVFIAIFINENFVKWLLAMFVGGLNPADGFIDAYKFFSMEGYLFFSIFRVIPYLLLFFLVAFKIKGNTVVGIGWGGLLGIVLGMIFGFWDSQSAIYSAKQVSSTTAIAFLIIPFFSIITGMLGGLVGFHTFKAYRYFTNKSLNV